MIRAYSQRLLPQYSGQVQIAESDRARAITMDGEDWEIHFIFASNDGRHRDKHKHKRSFIRVTNIKHNELREIGRDSSPEHGEVDERILELTTFLSAASLPFPAADRYEYWLLDPEDDSPLALVFSCTEAEQMAAFPSRPEWTALPAAVMPIQLTPDERERCDSPVNYRVEQLVAARAGSKPRARWFTRRAHEEESFPPCMVREDWQDEAQYQLCQRYIQRQSTRLLMLHGLEHEDRKRLELAARAFAFEVERFYRLYPEVVDEELMKAILVEARLRSSAGEKMSLLERRDGVLYL